MTRGAFVVRVVPASPDQEGELHGWYDGVHLPELLSVPGIVAARRYRRDADDGSGPELLAVYELDADDLTAPLAELRRRREAGASTPPPAALGTDPPPMTALWTEVARAGGPDAAAVVHELGRRFRAGDGPGARELLDPDLRIEQPASLPHGGVHHGPDGMAAMGATFAEHWDRTIGEADVRSCGDTAVQVTTQTWTSKATGKAATVDVVELFRVADGRITEIRVFQHDTHALLATLG